MDAKELDRTEAAIDAVFRLYGEMLKACNVSESEQIQYEEYMANMLDSIDSVEGVTELVKGLLS